MTNQETISLNVNTRGKGKHECRTLRKNKTIPAIVYGPKVENIDLSLSEIDAVRYSSHTYDNTIFTFKSEEGKLNGLKVLKKEMVVHPATHRPVHIDFYALDMTAAVRVHVELKYIGKPAGAIEGGLVQELRRDVEIECPASDIPHHFEINIEALGIGDVLHVSDIPLASNQKLITGADEAIVSVAQPKEEEPDTAATEAADGAAAPAEAKAEDKK